MQKWIIGSLLGFIMQGSAMAAALDGLQLDISRNISPLQNKQSLVKTEKKFDKQRSHRHHRCHRLRHHCHRHVKPCNIPGPMGPVGNPGPQGEGFQRFASYWLVNQPSLVVGQNVLFNLQQTLQGIQYDPTTGIFTLPAGVYVINFFATPSYPQFENTLNLNINGTVIPSPSLEGASVVVDLSADNNVVSVQATGNWFPQTNENEIASFFFAYASIAIYQIGS